MCRGYAFKQSTIKSENSPTLTVFNIYTQYSKTQLQQTCL